MPDVDLREIDLTLLGPENLYRIGEDFVRALPSVTRDPPRSRLEEGWVDLISETIANPASSPTNLSRQDAAALAETFRQALLRIHLSDSFMRDLWIRLHVHALLRGSYIFNGVELFPDTKPPTTANMFTTAKPPTNAEPSTTASYISAQSSMSAASSTVVETATIAESPTNAKSPNNAVPSTNMEPPIDTKPSTKPPDFEPSGFVDVWRGNYHGNPVCIKAIRTRNKSNLQKIKKVFYYDGQGRKHFSHPNILPVVEVSEELFPFCIMTPWMPGGNIIQYTQQKNPSANRLMLLAEACRGLSYLHEQGISHGCIAPGNILITRDGRACLGDFGVVGGFGDLSFPRFKLTTARYMALERLDLTGGSPSNKSDVYSLAMTSFTVLTGIFPYSDVRGHYSLIVRIKSGERPPRPTNPDGSRFLSDEVWNMITSCWSEDPNLRLGVTEMCEVFSASSLQEVQKVKTDIKTEGKRHGSKKFRPRIASLLQSLLVSDSETRRLVDEMDQRLESRTMPDKERKKLLNDLCVMCGRKCVIPNSMHIPDCSNGATEVEYRGGFASVSRSEYGGYQVAIKTVHTNASTLNADRSGFCREVVAWKHLRHPNILPLLGVTFNESHFAMVSEWMDHGNVNEFIRMDPDANRTALLADVANGLKYMHDLRMVHGDLKGANILVNKDRRACIADFSLTTITGVGAQTFPGGSQTSTFMSGDTLMSFAGGGTSRWMSPELLVPDQFGIPAKEGDRPTRQSDCYALGMVIYEVLCGIHPFYEIEVSYLITNAIIDGKRPEKPEGAERLGFNDELWAIVERCWKPKREERPAVEDILSCLNDATAFWYIREH